MKKWLKSRQLRLLSTACLSALVFLSAFFGSTVTVSATDAYNYDLWGEAIPAPDAYEYETSIRAEHLGLESMGSLSDIYCANDRIYIVMAGMLVVTDEDFNTEMVITEYARDGGMDAISAPQCVFATQDGDIYITEESRGEIIQFDADGNFVRSLSDPQIQGLDGVTYAPTKVVVDHVGRIYVKAKSVYEGIVELDPEGNFNRFVGANEVVPSLIDRFWRMIATEEQISRMALWLPTDYSDMTVNSEGYLLATVRSNTATDPIRMLNASGEDVLIEYEFIESPKGDYVGESTISLLSNIAAADDGRFAVLDANRSRIFVYSQDGLLVYVLGGSGVREGQLQSPVDVAFCGDKILVADLVSNSIEVYHPTGYGDLINNALTYQKDYDYMKAAEYWQQVYDINPTLIAANMGLGKYQLQIGDYEGAMESFERTGERENWSAAYERVREVWLEENLGTVFVIIILVIIALVILSKVLRRLSAKGAFEGKRWAAVLKKLHYTCIEWPKFVLSSPFKAFDSVKYEDAGSLPFCFAVAVLWAWASVIASRYNSFLINTNDVDNLNYVLIFVRSVAPYFIFIIANWAVGVLIDGKGNLKNVFKVNMYAMYPAAILTLIATALSRVVIYEEVPMLMAITTLGTVIYGLYTFIGLLTIHQYSFTKAVGSILLSVVAMVLLIFIIVLLATMLSSFINDIGTVIAELRLYM